jgi:SNF2 family DNA or RNA helicase
MSLLRYFTKGEKDGFSYLENRISSTKSDSMKRMLESIKKKFKNIASQDLNLKEGTKLYFFQKYCIHEILKARAEGKPGVILANEQGLGKTVTALALINGSPAAVISPNPVVSSWLEQEGKFIPESRLTSLEGSYKDRDIQLAETKKQQVVVNVEYMRGMNKSRARALSSKAKMLIIDEADYLGSKGSQQAQGTSMIDPEFKLLLTATPFKKPSQITNLLKFLYPNNEGFGSSRAFARAFSAGDNNDLNLLNILLNENTIRIRKRDVFEEYDPIIPLDQQSDKLPKKKIVEPTTKASGQFDLTYQQCLSILELFDDYQSWCEKHRSNGQVTDEDMSYSRFKEGFFQKKEALRQIMNNPRYIGVNESSPKHEAMDKLIKPRVGDGKKGLIFCRYKGQVDEYAKRYKDLGVSTYYGDLESNSNGYKVDSNGKVQYYKVDEFENPILIDGDFVEASKENGKPIRAFDYERIKFQNDPNTKVMIATYDAGSVGVTFTAADFVVFDDLAQTYRDEYQAMDRAHRIDNDRKKYEVEYLWLQAKYPESFLSRLNDDIRETYFDCGTYDEIHRLNIQNQSKIFHRILDGIGSDDELDRLSNLKDRMPFLFDTND